VKRLVLVPFVFILASGVAWAYWSAGSVPGGNGASAATTVNRGTTPTVVAAGRAVTVNWAASTLANGRPVAGYIIKRYDVATLTLRTMLSACAGSVTATTCTENSVPIGQWVYSVTPTFATGWTGPESPYSSPVTTDVTVPVNAVSMSVITGNAVKSGDTIYYRGASAGSFTLTNAVSDPGSGPASSSTASLTGATGWSHTPSTVSSPSAGPYVSTQFSWSAGATSAPTVVVSGRDVAGNSADTTLTFVNDSTGPTGGSVDASGLVGTGARYAISTTLSLTLNKGTDPSGVAPTGAQLFRSTGTVGTLSSADGIADGTCVDSFNWLQIFGVDGSTKSDTVSDQACYRYYYVVADMLGNWTTFMGTGIKVDRTAPTAPPALSFFNVSLSNNTYWSGTGSTVYYRSAAPGLFTVRATAIDTASGIASYAFPALGNNWTSTPVSLGANTYSWSGSPAVPGAKTVTATNNATGTSAGASFTVTADDTAPTLGALPYANTTTANTTFSVTLPIATDGGSGVGTRVLQRASTTLSSGNCGSTYSAFSTVANGINPTSPVVDSVGGATCYKYRYVVSDNVGNSTTTSSGNVVKDTASYFDTINATIGLRNYWRLGEAAGSNESFSGQNDNDELANKTGTWAKVALAPTPADAVYDASDRIRKGGGNTLGALYRSPVNPASADYTVEADVFVASHLINDVAGVVGRLNSAVSAGTFYAAVYDRSSTTWILYSKVNGTKSVLGQSTAQALNQSTIYRLALSMYGSSIRLMVNGVQQVSVVDSTINSAGRPGIVLGFGAATTTQTSSTGMHLDNFKVTPAMTDSMGTNHGAYLSPPSLGASDAIANDSNTAATFDGVNEFATAPSQISDDFSIELWFRSSTGIGTGAGWWQGAGLIDAEGAVAANDFGISLRSDGKVVAGVGAPVSGQDVSIVSTSGGYANGAWHHVVFTRTMTSGAMELFVDGVSVGSATGSTASLTSPSNIDIGRILTGNRYFTGTLDEVAVYRTVLSAGTVATHHDANR
jgi:hypothetical protein